ncbi:MAG TPA: SAM-dependent methyltransferase [Bacteriovoracaceae bacterium]|nr:SAM-dependent methyltransferase [Bacteriovoracaceae bacterium]
MGELILIPTPLQDDLPLETIALEKLTADCLKETVVLLVEEHKVARQRWLRWGLPREGIEKFILFNEHTQEKIQAEIIKGLTEGKKTYLMSDCGLPAFCDPGQKLVDACHKRRIKVTATPFPNSIALSLALSGFSHARFIFSGFIPVKEPERSEWIKQELKKPETQIWMETPYRLKRLVEDLAKVVSGREIFLAIDLGGQQELLLRGQVSSVLKALADQDKREFVLVVAPLSSRP